VAEFLMLNDRLNDLFCSPEGALIVVRTRKEKENDVGVLDIRQIWNEKMVSNLENNDSLLWNTAEMELRGQ